MTARDLFLYLAGNAGAIERVAKSRAAFPTGLLLVLLTSVPRNYDQKHISEEPVLWFLEPLLFSLVSGTWIYICAFCWLGRRRFPSPPDPAPGRVSPEWPGFMGLFWLTAPIAWLYAIPVERFLWPVEVAQANFSLLAIVALWRVLLIARVDQVLRGSRFHVSLAWILIAASAEAIVALFYPSMAGGILDRMAGLRDPPAEEVRIEALALVWNSALLVLPVAFITAMALSRGQKARRLPERVAGRVPWIPILLATAFWSTLALLVQPEVGRSARVEELVASRQYREALDYLAARQSEDFAPSRVLPPKSYGWGSAQDVAELLATARESDPAWLRQHLVRRLDEMVFKSWRDPQFLSSSLREGDHEKLLQGLQTIPEARQWAQANAAFLSQLAAEQAKR